MDSNLNAKYRLSIKLNKKTAEGMAAVYRSGIRSFKKVYCITIFCTKIIPLWSKLRIKVGFELTIPSKGYMFIQQRGANSHCSTPDFLTTQDNLALSIYEMALLTANFRKLPFHKLLIYFVP